MLLLRSIFWLSVAYVVIHPQVDLSSTAGALSGQAMAAGQKFVVEQIAASHCEGAACAVVPAAVTLLTSNPAGDSTMQDSHSTVPIPRPRPFRMG
jgi:hypothetical protein